ncbi:MAG: nickel pincer cofactor biosynthesis protein LarC [Planctomycetes bacterium]|nr:nickel pincer cofactor biosynthesis protein LarC [Planctomycetota bacterium]MCB9905363.1 nickel pincer cofactor biosynthesis protein LarC [Planctomycetota bacterium]
MASLLIQPFGGMAGDMFLAALLDLGDPRFTLEHLREFCQHLLPGEFELSAERTQRGSIGATRVIVETPETAHPPHRHLSDLLALANGARLSERGVCRVELALRAIGEAEARVHGVPVESVHFHEVGAVDTIIDVCGAAYALDRLEVDELWSTAPFVGGGTVDCAHGTMPVPVPAVVEIMGARPMLRAAAGGERLTPTGAAILAAWTEEAPDEHAFRAAATGYGAGTKDPRDGRPNLTSVALSNESAAQSAPLLEFAVNLDDTTGEELGLLLEGLRDAGALDVWCTSIQMKKGRPGHLVGMLAPASCERALARVVFGRSPSLGLRSYPVRRVECAREVFSVELLGRSVRVKRRIRPDDAPEGAGFDLSPEFDDLAAIARETGKSLRELEAAALAAAREQGHA